MYCRFNRIDCPYANENGYCDSTACHNINILGNIVAKEPPKNITDIDQEPTKNPVPKLGLVSLGDVLDKLEERKNIYREMNFDDDSEQIQDLIHIQADMLTLKTYRF